MYHHVARTLDHRLAFTTWEEGRRLWDTVVAAAPGPTALCVMPDHIHLLTPVEVRFRLSAALSGYTRWRNRRRGTEGPLWERLPEPGRVEGPMKLRRNIRYIHLNPCRAGLVDDPLAWPLSTHMDAVGLALEPVRRRAPFPIRFHAYVSGDPSAHVEGSPLPVAVVDVPDLDDVETAVSMAMRAPVDALQRRGDARRVFVGASRVLTPASGAAIGAFVGMSRQAVGRTARPHADALRVVERWIDDPRASRLDAPMLRHMLGRSRYRGHR